MTTALGAMTTITKPKGRFPSIETRFKFIGDAIAPGDREALRPALFEVEELSTGAERCLKLWRKVGSQMDQDLRELWRHEMRQVQRVMAYGGAKEVIVDVLEFIEDDEEFGIVLERVGSPLASLMKRVPRQHWLRNCGAPRARALMWRNVARMATALGIVHAQGLVHGKINGDSIFTEGSDEPDFQLGGLEWSLWLSADAVENGQAALGTLGSAKRSNIYSFATDWQSLGLVVAGLLNVAINASGDVVAGSDSSGIALTVSERILLRRLINPSRLDALDSASISRAIEDIITDVARATSIRAGTFIMRFAQKAKLGEAVYAATNGEISIDDFRQQLDWVRADLDCGVTLYVPRSFNPQTGRLKLITSTMVYRLQACRDDGTPVWDIAACDEIILRDASVGNDNSEERTLVQPIEVVASVRSAQETRARLGPDVLDWSAFAENNEVEDLSTQAITKKALLLVQAIEAIVKALEIYPIEITGSSRRKTRRYASLRASKDNDRDRLAKKIGLPSAADSLRRFFEEDQRGSDAKWRISQSPSLGVTRMNDVAVTFNDIVDENGVRAYEFEVDDDLANDRPLFLRSDGDAGTEQVIRRRLRNILALDTRVDLLDMLDDPWRIARSSREVLDETDEAFKELDKPKQDALRGLWTTLPSYFVVGPPGVGKTRLATEVLKRRFINDRSTRVLLSAQGHDALDNLQAAATDMLKEAGIDDVIVVRSMTPDRVSTSDEEVQRTVGDFLEKLGSSTMVAQAPEPIRNRIAALKSAVRQFETSREQVGREDRVGIHAFSNLVLDAANIVISTANSPDIERLVEEREQFDWVIVEEAAKATGPELVGPLMLSGRRLLIGDHHQLPPFDADRLIKILADHSLVEEALSVAEQLVGALFYESGLEDLTNLIKTPHLLKQVSDTAVRLLQPFRTFAEDDERRGITNSAHRPISATLTEQRRMDPAIAEIVSAAFYPNKLTTESGRARKAETEAPPFRQLAPLPASPVVIVNFDHVSSTGKESPLEYGRPRWHNPSEVEAVINVLRHIRAQSKNGKKPTLAVLSPYLAQVGKIRERIAQLKGGELAHLAEFASVRSGVDFVGTVDSFQGSEADLVVISLVRNNPRAGRSALGFLQDPRRMNVLLSRAKFQMVIACSLSFLQESVRGVNPSKDNHDLSFITRMLKAIDDLQHKKRHDGLPLAITIKPDSFRSGK